MTRMITENIELHFSHFENIVEAKEYLEELIINHGNMPIVDDSYYDDYDVHCTVTREASAEEILEAEYEIARDTLRRQKSSIERERYNLSDALSDRPPKPGYSDCFQIVHSFINNKQGVTQQDIENVKATYPDKQLQFRYVDKVAAMVETGNAPYEINMQKYEKELAEWLANESTHAQKLYSQMKLIDEELVKIKQEEANLSEAYKKAVNGLT